EGRQRYERITQIQGNLSDDDQCWSARAIFGSVATLAEPHASVWARTLAGGMSKSTAEAAAQTPLGTSASAIAQATSTPPPLSSSVASSPDRQDLLKASIAEADKYEAVQEWPRAIATYARLQKTFPETEVGRL